MINFCTLFSSSSGNSTYVSNGETDILVDAGGSCKSICDKLLSVGGDISRLKGILLTHEHIDHIKALKVLTKRFDIPIFANEKVLSYLVQKDMVSERATLNEIDLDKPFQIENLNIKAFKTSHDSLKSNGFVISSKDKSGESSLGVATDLGVFSSEILDALSSCDGVVLESNYDEGMLSCGSYPYMLKRRIMSEKGHLSNLDCSLASEKLLNHKSKHFILAHLSKENNIPLLARETTISHLNELGARENEDFTLSIASPDKPSSLVTI